MNLTRQLKFLGVKVMDDIVNNEYPMPINTTNQDLVFVGRIRRDFTNEKTLNMWIVADNLRKGAATNTTASQFNVHYHELISNHL